MIAFTEGIYVFEATLTSVLLSLLSTTFSIHLYNRPDKLNDLKSFKSSAPPFFGISTTKNALISLKN